MDLFSTRTSAVTAGVHGSRLVASRLIATWAASGEGERFPQGTHRTQLEFTLDGRLDS